MVVVGLLSWTQEDEEKESVLRQNTGKEKGVDDRDKRKSLLTFIKFTQAPMFPLLITSDLKLHASCVESEKQRAKATIRPHWKEQESGWEKSRGVQS